MPKKLITIENVSESSLEEVIQYLKKHEDYCLFLLGNLESFGYRISDSPYSGNYKLIRRDDSLKGVFCLTKGGNLLIHSELDGSVFEIIIEACQVETMSLCGLIGEWDFCENFWLYLKLKRIILEDTFVSKEVLYTLDVSEKVFLKDPRVRLLTRDDFLNWQVLNTAYFKEIGIIDLEKIKEIETDFNRMVDEKILWGLHIDSKLVSMARLNAKAFDVGQVGGVYTIPEYRKQGLANSVMHQLIVDVKELHRIRKLIIFTNEDNKPARKLYELLGSKQVGNFALLFGKGV